MLPEHAVMRIYLYGIHGIEGRSNELVILQTIETHCIPILSNAVAAIHVADRETRRKLH